jgi:hypothetical protein
MTSAVHPFAAHNVSSKISYRIRFSFWSWLDTPSLQMVDRMVYWFHRAFVLATEPDHGASSLWGCVQNGFFPPLPNGVGGMSMEIPIFCGLFTLIFISLIIHILEHLCIYKHYLADSTPRAPPPDAITRLAPGDLRGRGHHRSWPAWGGHADRRWMTPDIPIKGGQVSSQLYYTKFV